MDERSTGATIAIRERVDRLELGVGKGRVCEDRYVDATLADPLGIPASRMVGIVDELERRSLVERRRNPDDRRAYALHLTAEGSKVLKNARRIARDHDERLLHATLRCRT